MPLTVDIIPKMSIYERTNPYMEGKCMGFTRQKVWVMGYWRLWVMGCISPRTNLVDGKTYGLSQVMGYLKYGLWQVRLYTVYIKPGANQLALTVFRDQTYCQLQ